MTAPWPLVGRAAELHHITSTLKRAGHVVVLTGPVGVGKTRLAREAVTALGRPSRWVAAAKSAQAIPLGALARWVPGETPDGSSVSHTVTEALLEGTDGSGVVVAVDDAHLLDEQSAFVLQQLIHGRRVSVVITVREGEPVSETIELLWTTGDLEHIDLRQFSRHDVEQLLVTRLGGRINPVDVRHLYALTRGNVLYLRHIIDHALTTNQLERIDGVWTLSTDLVIPATLSELISRRIEDLPPRVADVVDMLALAEPLNAATLSQLAGEDALTEAQARGLVATEAAAPDTRLRLIHPMYGEVRRASAGTLRLRRLRGVVASTLTNTAQADIRAALRRAALVLDSDLTADPAEMLRAADIALWLYDPALASRFAQAAADAGGGWPAELSQAMCLINAGDNDQAEALFVTIAAKDIPDETRAHLTFLRVWNLQTSGGVDQAATMLTVARPMYPGEPAASAFKALESLAAACGGRPADAVATADTALACAELPEPAAFLALQAKAVGEGDLGRSDALSGLEEEADRRSASVTAGSMRMSFADVYAYSLRLVGRLTEAHDAIGRAADGVETRLGQSWLELMLAAAELAAGRADTAATQFRNIGLGREDYPDPMGWLFRARIDFVQACAISGDLETAQRMLALINANPHQTFAFLTPQRILANAWLKACQGWVSGAIADARHAAELANSSGQFGQEVVCLQVATRFGDTTTAGRLGELVKLVTGPRITATAPYSAALATSDGDGLDAACEQFHTMGDLLSAADASSQAAAAHIRAGRRGSALTSAIRARHLASQCGQVSTPALLALDAPAKLSQRQLEVVAMAANGLTNREIADLLGVSVRTVESHIYLACTIVGTNDRTQLVASVRKRPV